MMFGYTLILMSAAITYVWIAYLIGGVSAAKIFLGLFGVIFVFGIGSRLIEGVKRSHDD